MAAVTAVMSLRTTLGAALSRDLALHRRFAVALPDNFSYYLTFPTILALHEGRNNRAILDRLEHSGFAYHSVHALYGRANLNDVLTEVATTASSWGCPLGIEVDVDVLRHAPASSLNAAGVTIEDAYRYVAQLASLSEARYLHIPEAAPALHPTGTEAGMRACGQLLTELVLAFVHGRSNRGSGRQSKR